MNTTSPTRRDTLARATAVLLLAVALTFAGASTALAITRDQTLARAQAWVDSPVPYSQSRYHNGYRTDCSGYVSACWAASQSYCTATFPTVTHKIAASQLAPGDALLKPGYHIRLFYGWTDASHTSYIAYEANTVVAVCRIHGIADDLKFGYYPARYNHISSSPAPTNALKNGTFNVWARDWSSAPEKPVWWQTNAQWGQTLATHRKDTFRSARNALQLSNPSTDPGTFTELSQAAPVTAGVDYRLTAWAKMASDPRGLVLRLQYLDASGAILAEANVAGDAAAVGPTAFKPMSLLLATPTGTVSALVTMRLAGGSTTNTAGVLVPGTSAFLDDFCLERPRVAVGITRSATTRLSGQTVVVSGSVTPTASIGTTATVWVMRPGTTTWAKLASAVVSASGSGARWSGSLHFTRAMRRGVYRFKTTVPAVPGWLAGSSGVASVTLK